MSLISRLNPRQNWPLFAAEASFLILFLLFSIVSFQKASPYYHYQIGDKVKYSILLSQYSKYTTDYPDFLVIAAVIVALISLLGGLRITRIKALLLILFVLLTF